VKVVGGKFEVGKMQSGGRHRRGEVLGCSRCPFIGSRGGRWVDERVAGGKCDFNSFKVDIFKRGDNGL
jgi:hypothetical protein